MKVSEDQKSCLIEFMQRNAKLLSGKFSSEFTKVDARNLWMKLAEELNSLPGPGRDWKSWRKTWQDLRMRTKQKAAKNLKETKKTGGGTADIQPLNRLEKDIATLISPMAIRGLNVPQPVVTWGSTEAPSHEILSNEPSTSADVRFHVSPPISPSSVNSCDGFRTENSYSPPTSYRKLPSKSQTAPTPVTNVPVVSKRQKRLRASHDEYASYLKKKLEIKEGYYKEKLEVLRNQSKEVQSIAAALNNIANALLTLKP